jgi:ABC-type multidrug transport system fused ATPase/permease subunit
LIHNQFQVEDNSLCHDLSVFDNLVSSAEIIEIKNVSFSYKVNTPIIEGLSLSIGKLDKVVIVGKSGAGKTTLSDLITGMILPTEGEIIFNGEVISFSNLSYLRSHVSLVTQFPFVLSGTIANNVTYSFGKAIDVERIKLVLSQVGLMEFVSTLHDGLDTKVGDGGCSFSGGQLQRIGIARALYRDTPIILFDEPTSSLDPNSEKVIIDLISNLSISKTVITISHSLEVIKNHDRVILMENGRIIEQGGYDDLICNSEKFKDLLQSFENKI